jgi:hypothetical protein
LKILNADGQYSLPSNVKIYTKNLFEGYNTDYYASGKFFGMTSLYIYEKNQDFISITLMADNNSQEGKIKAYSSLKRQNNPTFESQNDLSILAEFLNGYSKTFMKEIPKNEIFYTLKKELGVGEGGGNNSSNTEGTTSQKTYDNFDEWINTIQDANIKGKIEAYHELLSPEQFNVKIKSMF